MGESQVHRSLVERMAAWVAAEVLGGDGSVALIDSSALGRAGRPPAINGYVPDLYAEDRAPTPMVVGEAKTARDLETERSERQIGAFLEYCSVHGNALLVLAVPWHCTRSARSMLCALKGRLAAEVVATRVLDMLPG